MTSKYSCLQTVFSVSEYAKTHLQQFVISKFWIPAPDAPLHDRTRGLIYWTPLATECQVRRWMIYPTDCVESIHVLKCGGTG